MLELLFLAVSLVANGGLLWLLRHERSKPPRSIEVEVEVVRVVHEKIFINQGRIVPGALERPSGFSS